MSDPGARPRPAIDLVPLAVLVVGSALAVVILDLTGVEPGASAPLWQAPASWGLVVLFPVIVAALDAVVTRLRLRLPWREAIRRVRVGRILELAAVVAALRLLLLTAVARKEAIPHLRGGFVWDERLAAADAWLHGGVTPDRYLTWLIDSPALLRALDFFYLEVFWVGCVGTLLWWGWQRGPRRGQFFAAFALVWLLLGAVCATIFASAGPCFYALVTGHETYARLMEALHRQPLAATAIQDLLWRNYRGEATGVVEGISAFPSIHVAMPALFALSARGAWRWPAWIFCALVLLGSVALGWHYALDGYAAIAGAWLCWWIGGKLAGWTARRQIPLRIGWLVAGSLIAGALPQFLATPLPDLAWLLYSARRMLEGATLYRDLVEVNPPLIVWLNLLPAVLARALGVPNVLVYRLMVLLAAVASLLLCRTLLGRLREPEDAGVRRLMLLLISVALVLLAGPDFGEREHLMLVLALPYILLSAVRAEEGHVRLPLSVAVGLLTGIGIALKPYFVLLPVALEGWLLLRRRSGLVRPETLAIAAIGGAYLAAVQLWAPSYWAVYRVLGLAYYRFLQEPLLLTAITGQGAALALCSMLAYAALRDRERPRPLWTALLVATAALYLSAVLQRKGWRYHFYPSMATGLLLLGLLATGRRRTTSPAGRLYAAVAVAVTIFLPLFLLGTAILHTVRPETAPVIGDPDLPRLAEVVRREGPHGGLLVLSTNMASAFPLVTETGARWTSRFPSVWPLGTEYGAELNSAVPIRYRAPGSRTALEQYLTSAVSEDLSSQRPDLLIVLRAAPDQPGWGLRRLDYLEYFAADAGFARELTHYGFLEDVGEYRVYRRLRPGETARSAPPSGFDPRVTSPVSVHPGLQVALPGAGTALAAGALLLLIILAYRRGGPEERARR